MEKKKINVEETINAILEQEGKEKGIQLIRDIVNSIAKGRRKKQIRTNTYDSIAREVYSLMYKDSYSRVRAIEKIAKDKSLSESSINNHLGKFNKEAKDNDYLNFGRAVDALIHDNCKSAYGYLDIGMEEYEAEKYGDEFRFSKNLSITFYFKYKIDIDKKENRDFERDYTKYEYRSIPF